MIDIRDRIERRPLEHLVPYSKNSRTHSEEQIAQLVESMQQWGWTNPVLVDEAGVIIAGHGRVLAAQRLGLSEVPVIVAAGWSEDQKRAYVIADNKLALNAGWDEAVLRSELEHLRLSEYDLGLLGFGEDELDELFAPEQPAGGPDPDQAPALSDVAVSVLGDVWILGPHRIACGDSTSIDAWDALMRGELADCVWTDPPYNVNYESKLAGKIANDALADSDFLRLLQGAFACLSSVMKPGASIYVAHADGEPGYAFRRAFRESGFKLSGCLIWKKTS